MSRKREYRQRLKYTVKSAREKTMTNRVRSELENNFGLSQAESELLAENISDYILSQDDFRSCQQILVPGAESRRSFYRRRQYAQLKEIKITPIHFEDLNLRIEYRLKSMQKNRLMRLIEEAYTQDSLLTSRDLSLILNISANSLRKRLREIRKLGIYAPTAGMSKEQRVKEDKYLYRSSWLLKQYFQNEDCFTARKASGISRQRFRTIQKQFNRFLMRKKAGNFTPFSEKEKEWERIAASIPRSRRNKFQSQYPPFAGEKRAETADFKQQLKDDFGYSPIMIRAIYSFIDEIKYNLKEARDPGQIIYWTVATGETAGKPLSKCQLIPATITYLAREDRKKALEQSELKNVSGIKFAKILRYSTEAKASGGNLNYADLSFLLGMHTGAIRRLIDKNKDVVIPLRGIENDIGRGMSHKRKIIRLYLEMHTETEIVTRTGHSYEAIENYLKEFATVLVLKEKSLPAAMIRKITGRSLKLINVYLELIREYSSPEYAFRLGQLKRIFYRPEKQGEKRGP